jgi:hypothetical protein
MKPTRAIACSFPSQCPVDNITLRFVYPFARRFLHVIVPEGEAKCYFISQILFHVALILMAACRAGPSEYQGLMNALKRKMDDGNQLLNQEMQALKQETQALRKETQAVKQELQGQLAEVIKMLRSKP